MQQRLAAGDHHHGRAAFVDRLHAIVIGQALVEDLVGIIDLAAARASKIAAEQGLQHQHQRITLAAQQMLLDDIGANTRAFETQVYPFRLRLIFSTHPHRIGRTDVAPQAKTGPPPARKGKTREGGFFSRLNDAFCGKSRNCLVHAQEFAPVLHPPGEEIGAVARLVSLCARRKWLTLIFSLALALAAGWYAAGHFALSTDLNKLISPDLPWRKREIALSQTFPQRQDMLVAVLDAPGSEHANAAARRLEAALRSDGAHFSGVRSLETSAFFAREGLLYLPASDVDARMGQLIDAQPFLGALARDPSLRGLADTLKLMAKGDGRQTPAETAQMGAALGAVAGALQGAAEGKPSDVSWSALFSGAPASVQDKRRFLEISPKLDYSALEPGADASDAVRAAAKDLGLTPENGYRLRLTGDVALQDEEFGTLAEGAALNTSLMIAAVLVHPVAGAALGAADFRRDGEHGGGAGAHRRRRSGDGGRAQSDLRGLRRVVRGHWRRFRHPVRRALSRGTVPASRPRRRAPSRRRRRQPAAGAGCAATAAGFFSFMPTDYRGVSELGEIAGRRHDPGVRLHHHPAAGLAGDPANRRRRIVRSATPFWRWWTGSRPGTGNDRFRRGGACAAGVAVAGAGGLRHQPAASAQRQGGVCRHPARSRR